MAYSCAVYVRVAIPAVYPWLRRGRERNPRCRMRFPVGHVVRRNETKRVELGWVGADRRGCRSAQLHGRSLISAVCCLAGTQVCRLCFMCICGYTPTAILTWLTCVGAVRASSSSMARVLRAVELGHSDQVCGARMRWVQIFLRIDAGCRGGRDRDSRLAVASRAEPGPGESWRPVLRGETSQV
jgi:hypothetical protein